MNLRAYCDSRLQKLVEHVHEGYRHNFWLYDDTIANMMKDEVAEFNERQDV